MVKTFAFTILFLIFKFTVYGQNDSLNALEIDQYVYQLDSSHVKIDSSKFDIDSIQIILNKYANYIETISYFKKSKTFLKVNYYLKNQKLVLALVTEKSPYMTDMYRQTFYYFEAGKIIFEKHRATWPLGLSMAVGHDLIKMFGYNENLNYDFLKSYTVKLYSKL